MKEFPRGWRDFQKDILEEILSWLPVESLCRYRRVCKEWDALFTSTRFITDLWKPNKKPWLIFYSNDFSSLPFPAYCFSTQRWESCPSLSFILGPETPESGFDFFKFYGSAGGLFLVTPAFHRRPPPTDSIVCNPLTRNSFKLPAMSSITQVLSKGIVQDGESGTYRVVALGESTGINGIRQQIVEIYDSSQKSWRTAGMLQDNLVVIDEIAWVDPMVYEFLRNPMVFSNDGFFYCMTTHPRWGIVGFSMRDGSSFFAALPQVRHGEIMILPQLVVRGSRVLIAGIAVFCRWIPNPPTLLEEVILWEFHNSSWTEIARMPSSILTHFRTLRCPRVMFEFVQVGDFVCFRPHRTSREVAVYDMNKSSWKWLPFCPCAVLFFSCTAFEPRPDMKVN